MYVCVYVCVWGAHGTLGAGTNKRYFFLCLISITYLISQLDIILPIANYWQDYCGTLPFVYAFDVVHLTIIVCVVA